MKHVELYAKVRHAVRIEGLSKRAVARRFGVDPRTVDKMLEFSVPPGYRRSQPPVKPKLGPFIAIIDAILAEDKVRPKKQQHTSKRIFERLRDEHGFTGGMTIVKDYVARCRQRSQEMFVPLAHPPGHAQVDFGEAIGIIGGGGTQDPLLGIRPAAVGRLFCDRVSGGDDGGVVRRSRAGIHILWRCPEVDPVRQHQDRGGSHSW